MSYYERHYWIELLFDSLKNAGTKGLTLEEIEIMFPSKTRQAIMAVLHRYKVPRRPFKDKKTRKCRKVYLYPNLKTKSWKEVLVEKLKNTVFGMSLTDILMQTGAPKKETKQYLKELQNNEKLCSVDTVKYNCRSHNTLGNNVITRYYIGNRKVKVRSDEILLSDYLSKKEILNKCAKEKESKLLKVANIFLKKNKRVTTKEIVNYSRSEKEKVSDYYIRKVLIRSGFKSEFLLDLINPDSPHHHYSVFYLGKEVPLLKGEAVASTFPLMLKKFIIEELEIQSKPKDAIKDGVGHRLGFTLADMIDGWGHWHVPKAPFQKAFINLQEERKITKHREADLVYYSLNKEGL